MLDKVERNIIRWGFCVQYCSSYSLLKIRSKSYSMAFNGNYSAKFSNITLLLEKKQMFARLNKLSSE